MAEAFERDVCRLIARRENTIVACDIDIAALRRFQRNPDDNDEYKPLPPGFVYRR